METALRQVVAQRKRAIESRGNVRSGLRIPVRQSSPSSEKSAVSPVAPSKAERRVSPTPRAGDRPPQWDVFISHASEDKVYVEPLVEALTGCRDQCLVRPSRA